MRRVVTVPPGIARRSIVVSSIPMVRRKHRRPNSPKNHLANSSGMCWIADQTKVREIRHETSFITGLCRAACLPLRKGERKLKRRSKALHIPLWHNRSLWA